MTIFDYLERNCGATIYKDEYGNAYMEMEGELCKETISGVIEITNKTDGAVIWLIPKELYEKHSKIEIVITEDESVNAIRNVRRPYYRMRGVPVTREQAFDIIRRTDNDFPFSIRKHEDYIGCMNFDNWLIDKNHHPMGYGWIHVDGTIGSNAITQKYPTVSEFVEEWYRLLYEFPYLDLIIAVTWWNEGPYDNEIVSEEEFYKEVAVGIRVHDRKLEILDRSDTIAKYKEYNKRYGTPPEKFEPEYYERHKIRQVDQAYLKKCIEAYGLESR